MANLTVRQAISVLGICNQMFNKKIKRGDFPGAHKCECGNAYLIPEDEVYAELGRQVDKAKKRKA